MKLLVPLDESPGAERALPYALALTERMPVDVVLVRVPDRPPAGVRPFEIREGSVAFAEEYLAERGDAFTARGARSVSALVRSGSVAQILLETVVEHAIDLVVMTTHGRSGLGRWVYGGVTHSILARCPVPVMLIRSWRSPREWPGESDTPRILVPLDGSRPAEAALPAAQALALPLGWEVRLLQVSATPDGAERAREYLASLAGKLEPARVASLTSIAAAESDGILAEDASCSLVVMTAYGVGGPGRQLLGGTIDMVLRVGSSPLVVLGPAALAAARG